jgi:hypothetical protein
VTGSRTFPTTPGTVQRGFGGGRQDAFVAKLSADGPRLLASTFLGGSGDDRVEGVAVDAAGNVYLTGVTTSQDFPLTDNALQRRRRGPHDAFAAVLTPGLDRVLYASYLGGDAEDNGRAAAVDLRANFLLAGISVSRNWPTLNAHKATFGSGASKGVLVRFGWTGADRVSRGRKTAGIPENASGVFAVSGLPAVTGLPDCPVPRASGVSAGNELGDTTRDSLRAGLVQVHRIIEEFQ